MKTRVADYSDYLETMSDGSVFDETLYRLCDEHLDHGNFSGVHAKLLLIGRGMATQVERQVKASGKQGDAMWQMALHLQKHRRGVDNLVRQLRSVREPLDTTKLSKIVAAHGKFCELVSRITRDRHQPASFASKYLHFHAPIVPVYDSWANWLICRWYRKQTVDWFPQPANSHWGYYRYCVYFGQLYSELRHVCKGVTVRAAESYLGWRAAEE